MFPRGPIFLSYKGFTLVELLVVIAIIGILSTVVMTNVNSARAKARDARRKMDLAQLSKAFTVHFENKGNYVGCGSNCGSGGCGNGWLNYVYSPYGSVTSCLISGGEMAADIKDPTGSVTSSPTAGFAYMKYTCGSGTSLRTSILAKLETVPQSATAVDGSCCTYCDTSYGMNYYVDAKQ